MSFTVTWTKGWPKETGNYWFYGNRNGYKVRRLRVNVVSNGVMMVMEGVASWQFVFPHEVQGDCWWAPRAEPRPEPPPDAPR